MADEAQILVQSLVERAQSGDGGAFGELYEQFAPEIFRYLLRHLNGRRESAEDLTEEVFLKVLERLGSYQFRGLPFSAWLYRIARNHMIDHLRSRPRQIISSLDAAPEIPEKRAEQVMDRSLDRHELTYALERLTSDQRHVVTLRFLDGFTTAETAEIMGKTEDAVKKLQARGLVQLRRIIEQARRAEEMPPVCAYGSELNQVWTNLIDNAAQAMEGKGRLTIRTEREGDMALVKITDNGPGIPMEIKHRIFDPFFTTKGVGIGTGLGLDIVRRVVRHHGGNIEVRSQPGETTFSVWLPLEKS